MIRRLWDHRYLVSTLTYRQFRLRYRQSAVGLAWAILPPLITLGAGTIVFHEVAGVQTGNVPYAVFALAALAPWTLFANSLTFGVPSVVGSMLVVTRFSFPKAVLPVAAIGTALIDLSVAFAIFVIFALATGTGLPPTALWFPVLLAIELILCVGVALFASALNVFARDVRIVVPLFVQLWLLLTPVMYSLSDVPEGLRRLYLLNPMTGVVESFRRILVGGRAPDVGLLLPAAIGAAVALVVGFWYFHATESRFADVI